MGACLYDHDKTGESVSGGFALPTVLISSMIMLIVLVASVVSTSALRSSFSAQYYNQIAQSASDAGSAYAKACLESTNGVAKWGDGSPYQTGGPLMPGTNCAGALLSGLSCDTLPNGEDCVILPNLASSGIVSTFSVGAPIKGEDGKVQSFSSVGKVNLLRKSDGSTWRTYSKNTISPVSFHGVATAGLVMNLDAGDTTSYSGTGTTWTDLTGNLHNGTLASGVGYDGDSPNNGIAKSITFDGLAAHYASVGFLGNFWNQGTISFWMKPTDTTAGNYRNPFTTNFTGATSTNAGIRFEHGVSTTSFAVAVGVDNATSCPAASSCGVFTYSPSIAANSWYHVVLAWDKVNNNITGYLNGDVVTGFDHVAHSYWPTALPNVAIGAGYDTTRNWKGSISSVQMYNRALSPGEVKQNYTALSGRYN